MKQGVYLWAGIMLVLGYGCLAQATVPASLPGQLHNPAWVEIIGLVAGFGTTFAALPDCIVMFNRRSTRGMHPRMATITGTFQILWLIYGLLIQAPAVIFWNAIAIVTNAITVSAYLYFAQQEKQSEARPPYNEQ
jgi:MtN3 and saliva related transmembrane protein